MWAGGWGRHLDVVVVVVVVPGPGRGQMHRLPDQDPRVPEGIQRPCVRWTVHRTNYHGQIRAHRHRPARGASVLQFSHSALALGSVVVAATWEGSRHPLRSELCFSTSLPRAVASGRQPTLKELSNDGGRRRPPPGSSSVCGRHAVVVQWWWSAVVRSAEGWKYCVACKRPWHFKKQAPRARRGDYMTTL